MTAMKPLEAYPPLPAAGPGVEPLKNLHLHNPLHRCKNELAAGHLLNPYTGKIEPTAMAADWLQMPWDHVVIDPALQCKYYMHGFRAFSFIFSRCRECFKVVAKPQFLRQLFQVRDLQQRLGYPAKCGIETREYTPGLYGAYWYCRGHEAGLDRLEEVRTLIHEMISPDIDVYLKRYCTEFELEKGPSERYQPPPDADVREAVYWDMLDIPKDNPGQPELSKRMAWWRWINFGWKYGSAEDRRQIEADWNQGHALYSPPTRYERGYIKQGGGKRHGGK